MDPLEEIQRLTDEVGDRIADLKSRIMEYKRKRQAVEWQREVERLQQIENQQIEIPNDGHQSERKFRLRLRRVTRSRARSRFILCRPPQEFVAQLPLGEWYVGSGDQFWPVELAADCNGKHYFVGGYHKFVKSRKIRRGFVVEYRVFADAGQPYMISKGL